VWGTNYSKYANIEGCIFLLFVVPLLGFSGPDNGNKIFWYSFDMGLVHFISLSSEHDTAPLSLQYTWLEDNLKSVDRTVTPWLLVAFHRPLYNRYTNVGLFNRWLTRSCSQDFHPDFYVGIHRRAWLEDLLFTYNVDMVLAGHYHSYACILVSRLFMYPVCASVI